MLPVEIKNVMSNQILLSVVLLTGTNGDEEKESGTGFFCSFNTSDKGVTSTLITCRHVVENLKDIKVYMHTGSFRNSSPTISLGHGEIYKISDEKEYVVNHPDSNIDLAAIHLAAIKPSSHGGTRKPLFLTLPFDFSADDKGLGSLSPIEEVYLIGFPSGIKDSETFLPITRRGITASHPSIDFSGKSDGLVDVASFPGSSGSPILILNQGVYSEGRSSVFGNRLIFLGVLKGFPYNDREDSLPDLHLGYYTKSKALLGLMDELTKREP